jgi:hypothetical protein
LCQGYGVRRGSLHIAAALHGKVVLDAALACGDAGDDLWFYYDSLGAEDEDLVGLVCMDKLCMDSTYAEVVMSAGRAGAAACEMSC